MPSTGCFFSVLNAKPTADSYSSFRTLPERPVSSQASLVVPVHSVHLVTLVPGTGQPQSTSQPTLSHGIGPGSSLEKSADQRIVSDSTPPSLDFFVQRGLLECLDLAFIVRAQLQSTESSPSRSDVSWVVSGWVPGGPSVYNWPPLREPSPWEDL